MTGTVRNDRGVTGRLIILEIPGCHSDTSPMVVTIPGVCTLTDGEFDWLTGGPVSVQALGTECRFVVDGFDPSAETSLIETIRSFCALTADELRLVARDAAWAYYQDHAAQYASEPGFPLIPERNKVWDFVTFGADAWVTRIEEHWYVSVENECAWEPEHGLQLVLKDGRQLIKLGQVDGHVTNRRAWGDASIPDDAVYWSPWSGHTERPQSP